MNTFYLYWHNNPTAQTVQGRNIQEAVQTAGISDDRLNRGLAFWSATDSMEWDSSDTGYWVSKR